jgi:exo-beta-1,3-glucanase (GH17 family)
MKAEASRKLTDPRGTSRRERRGPRPGLECLEERVVLATAAEAALFAALTTQRYWVDYAPSYDSASDRYNANPSDQRITSDLTALYKEGWRGLVTYTLLGTYADIPRIAKSIGFRYVIAGIYAPTNSTEVAEASSAGVLPYADGFVVGNEGLQDKRYTLAQLTTAIATVQQATGKTVTTSEPGGQYYARATYSQQLLALGDWLFPNIDYFLFPDPSTPQQMWTNVSFVYAYMLENQKTPGPVVAKEVFYPTAGAAPVASDADQIAWYGNYAVPGRVNGQPFYFVWGEAFDQPWKSSINSFEPHMGLHLINNADGSADPKPIISQLQADFTGTYPSTSTPTPTPTPSPPPTIIGEQVLTHRRLDSRGRPMGRSVPAGFALDFSAAMDPGTAGDAADYQVAMWVRRRRKLVLRPVRFRATYDAATHSVSLILRGGGKFPRGGRVTALASSPGGISAASGTLLDGSNEGAAGNDGVFRILPRARGITR